MCSLTRSLFFSWYREPDNKKGAPSRFLTEN